MALVPAKCTQCGGNIEVDDTHEAGICQHCGTPFITEKAINNYNVTNNINANVVNIYGGSTNDFEIRAGTLEKYNGASTEVVVPNSVTAIGKEAFKDCKGLISVILPDGIISIEEAAFYNCENLRSINIPDSVSNIGQYAFYCCRKLESINIPYGVTYICTNVFRACASITKVDIPNTVTYIGECAFAGCGGLSNVDIPNSVEHIGQQAFWGCRSFTSITIPNSVISIGEAAFADCKNLSNVVYSVNTRIGKDAFDNTPYNSVLIKAEFEKTNKETQNSGCYIATCVYGSYDCPQVWTLRRYRDYTLDETWYGRLFIKCYYAVSPKLVKWFGKYDWFRKPWKKFLDVMVKRLNSMGVEDTKYIDKY